MNHNLHTDTTRLWHGDKLIVVVGDIRDCGIIQPHVG